MKGGVPIVPAWINGTFQAYPRRAKIPKIYPIQIYFGKPLVLDKYKEDAIIDENVLISATERILDSIASAKRKLEDKLRRIYT